MRHELDLNAPVTLNAFGENFQRAILGWCLADAQFLSKCRATVEPGWFTLVQLQDLARVMYDIYDTKKELVAAERTPKVGEIVAVFSSMFPKVSDKQVRVAEVDLCQVQAKSHDFLWITMQMTGWIRMIRLKYLVEDAQKQFKSKQFDKCIQWVDQKINEVKKASFMEDLYVSFEDPVGFLLEQGKILDADCSTFGHHEMDELLKPGSKHSGVEPVSAEFKVNGKTYFKVMQLTRGSLLPGDMTVLMGPTNSGKTTTVLTTAVQNLLMGKYVGLITHEQDARQLRLKILAAMMQMPLNDLTLKIPHDPILIGQLDAMNNILKEQLKFVHYAVPGKMFIEDVVPIVEQMQEDTSIYRNNHPNLARRCNRGMDLLIWDYPAKLRSRALNSSQVWDERTYVYSEALNLGQTYGFHVLAPVQTNRQGFRVGRGDTTDGRMVELDDVAEGFGIMTIAANVITINRSDNYKRLGIIRYHVAKCRSNETGWSLVVPTKFAESIAYDLSRMSKKVGPGQDISEQELIEGLGLSINAPQQNNAAQQNSVAQQQRTQDLQAARATTQLSPEVPPGQPVDPATGPPPATTPPVVP